jgi:hypothetical protein
MSVRAASLMLLTAVAVVDPGGSPVAACGPTKPKLSGPYTHENLTLFLIHGPDVVKGRTIVTLQEALERKIVVVHETSNVSQLAVENTASDVELFVMAGDVVKGGKQDRAIAMDTVVPPRSGKVPLPTFCVEQGRWQKRGAEADGKFSRCDTQIVGRALKQALNEARQQGEVWKEVAEAQKKLTDNVGKNVQNAASPSSLALALEDKDLNERLAKYESALADVCKGKNDAIGVAVVVNGIVAGADVFGSSDLFGKMWPKLLKSAAAEALAELKAGKKFDAPPAEAVAKFLADAATGESEEIASSPPARGQVANVAPQQRPAEMPTAQPAARVRVLQYRTAKSILLESQEKEKPAGVFHRCYIAK